MPIQIIQPSPAAMQVGQLGQAFGTGLSKRFPDPQQMVQRGLLQESMNKLLQPGSFEEKMASILPTLATTPGGSDILSSMLPLLQKQAQADAYRKYLESGSPQVSEQAPGLQTISGETQEKTPTPSKKDIRRPQPPAGSETTYPAQTAGPQTVPLMTPEEKNQRRLQITAQYAQSGIPADPSQIENIINQEDQSRNNYNEQVRLEQERREGSWDKMADQAMARFTNAGLGKSPEDETVFKKFMSEARFADNPNEIYEYARDKYRQFENARNAITNEFDLPGPLTKMVRQATGTYKSKEDMKKSFRPHIEKLKDLGLIPEARNLLSNSAGFGTDDVESTIFPPTKEEIRDLIPFRENPNKGKVEGLFETADPRFPAEESALSPQNYDKFKEQIESYLSKNPEANLITLRSSLNQDKKYGWQDINRSIVELIDEGRFDPDAIQEQQLNVIKQAPLPGLLQLFKHIWTGKK